VTVYIDHNWVQQARATVAVDDDRPQTITVAYRNAEGDRFRLKFRQRPNPIGFHVVLPGDKRPVDKG
jgi:hypothetical protein